MSVYIKFLDPPPPIVTQTNQYLWVRGETPNYVKIYFGNL